MLYIKACLMTAIIGSICNYIYTLKRGKPILPWEVIPAFLLFFLVLFLAIVINSFLRKQFPKHPFPTLGLVTIIGLLISMPGFSPLAPYVKAIIGKINLMPLITPVLAYTGISAGKDLSTFKQQGIAIIITTLVAFVGTYVGSAIIANISLRALGII